MNIIRHISKLFVGLLFIFSGTVKAIDPLGTVYKLQDYFSAFNIGFLKDLALVFTILLCTAEFIAGISLLFNLRYKNGLWLVIIMMSVFTPLTLILAIKNPVSDCGCFGDAIKLTNWQTFWKNAILLIPSLFLFITRNRKSPVRPGIREWTILSALILVFIAFILYNLRYLPVIDFLPYKTGTYIPEKMIIPDGKEADRYETTFVYEKGGITKEFTLDNYPADDTAWHFVDQKSVLVKKGYEPPIHDLTITSVKTGEDISDQILSTEGYILLMISTKIEEADPLHLDAGYALGDYCLEKEIDFYVLTASGSDKIMSIGNGHHFCHVDEITLKTIVRANPGYVLLKNGTIKGKWSWANVPGQKSLQELIDKL
jgi:hypothetical protein